MSRELQGLEQLGELSLNLQSLEALEARKRHGINACAVSRNWF